MFKKFYSKKINLQSKASKFDNATALALLRKVREEIASENYRAAEELAGQGVRRAGKMHEFWRLRIEARAKSGYGPDAVRKSYLEALRAGKLDKLAAIKQALHVLRVFVLFIDKRYKWEDHSSSNESISFLNLDKFEDLNSLMAALSAEFESVPLGPSSKDAELIGHFLASKCVTQTVQTDDLMPFVSVAVKRIHGLDRNNLTICKTAPAGLLMIRTLLLELVQNTNKTTFSASDLAIQTVTQLPLERAIFRRESTRFLIQKRLRKLVSEGSQSIAVSTRKVGILALINKIRTLSVRALQNALGKSLYFVRSHRWGPKPSSVRTAPRMPAKSSSRLKPIPTILTPDPDTLFKTEDFGQAFEGYVGLIHQNPEDRRSLDRASLCLKKLGEANMATKLIDRLGPAYAQKPNNEKHLFKLAIAAASLNGESRNMQTPLRLQAEDFLHGGLRRNKKDEEFWRELLRIHIARAQYDQAQSVIAAYEKNCPTSPYIPLGKSLLARFIGDLGEAEKQAQRALEIGHKSYIFSAKLHLSDAYLAKGQIALACETLRGAIPLNPGNQEAKLKYVNSLIMIGALQQASEAAESYGLGRLMEATRGHLGSGDVNAVNVILGDASPHFDGLAIADDQPAKNIASLVRDSAQWLVISRAPLCQETVRRLSGETRSAVGYTYCTTVSADELTVTPAPANAYAMGLRTEDFLQLCSVNPNATAVEVLSFALLRLSGQFVPIDDNRSKKRLELQAMPASAEKLLSNVPIPEHSMQTIGWQVDSISTHDLRSGVLLHSGPVLVGWQSLDKRLRLQGTRSPLILSLVGLTSAQREDIDRSDKLKDTWQKNLRNASVVIVTDRDVAEWLEDTFKLAVPVRKNLVEGLVRARAFLKRRFVVHLGAGLGNQLQGTPVIRFLSEFLQAPVDVCISSVVPNSHELYGESDYVNLAFYSDSLYDGREYDDAFICSTSGSIAHGIRTRRLFNQRHVYDFYPSTRLKPEARYNFNGLWHLIGNKKAVETAPILPFIRNFSDPVKPQDQTIPIRQAKISIGAGKRGTLWGNRQWPYFELLANDLRDLGTELYCVGAPGEDVPGCTDLTNMKLRDSIRKMAELDIFVGSDGGAFHIADALQLPTVVVFGPTGLIKNGPMSANASVLRSDISCAPCQFRFEFTSCQAPLCMQQVQLAEIKREVLHKLEFGGSASLNSYQDAVALELDNQEVQVREQYQAQYLGESFSLYRYFNGNWEGLLSASTDAKRMSRSKQILEWKAATNDIDDTYKYARARFSYVNRDFEDCISYCLEDELKVARPWVLRNLMLRCFVAQQNWQRVADYWDVWAAEPGEIRKDQRAWVDTAQSAIRALALVGRKLDAARLKDQALEFADAIPALAEIARQMDDSHYRLPGTRNWTQNNALGSVLNVGIVEPWAKRPSILKRFHPKIEVFAFRKKELDSHLVEDIDLFVVPFERELEALASEGLPVGLVQVGKELVEGGSGWLLLAPKRHLDGKDYKSVSAWLSQRLTAPDQEPAKRIMVVAHHHLEKYNPRGGERSTKGILEMVQAEGYETIVVVEHKKTKTSGLDETNMCRYVLAGHYAFSETLEATIACWRPDGVLTYGGAGLTAARICKTMGVPYIYFPRDWQEIVPPPSTSLLDRPRVYSDDNVYLSALKSADKVITNAQYVGSVIKKIYDVDSITSYVPVAPPECSNTDQFMDRKEIVLINAKKFGGGDLVREVAPLCPNLSFRVIGGDGKPFPPNVTVEEFFNGSEYSEMYQTARLFLFPLGDEDPCGTGRVVFEALHCNVPVISVRRGGMIEVLPNEWLTTSNTPEDWVRLINLHYDHDFSQQFFDELTSPFLPEKQLIIVRNAVRKLVN